MEKDKSKETIKISKPLFFGIIAIAIVALAFVFLSNQFGISNPEDTSSAAAIVNGKIISFNTLDNSYNSVVLQYPTIQKKDVLDQLIQMEVIYQESQKQTNLINEEEILKGFEVLRNQSGITQEEFSNLLESRNLTYEEFFNKFKREYEIQNFINKVVFENVNVTDEEISKYYEDNPEQFLQPESVTVRHILINDENLTSEEKLSKANEILSTLNENNFCEKVNKSSGDLASVSSCGEYTFTMGDPLVTEFKELSFNQSVGEMGIVQTDFGSHIIWTVKKNPEEMASLDTASLSIKSFLKNKIKQDVFKSFYEETSKKYDIQIFLE